MLEPTQSKYFVQSIEYKSEVCSRSEEYLYDPLRKAVQWVSIQVRRLQSGSLRMAYFFFVALVVILGLLLLGR